MSRPGDRPRTDAGSVRARSVPKAEVLAAIEAVEGWLRPEQAAVLHRVAARCAPGDRIVEIGSFRGRSTIVLGMSSDPGVEVIAVDPHGGAHRGPREITGHGAAAAADSAAMRANLAAVGLDAVVQHLPITSMEALELVPGRVDVVFVDGAHDYRSARADIAGWGARLRPGGTMLLHDAFSSVGVTLAILRELLASGRLRYAGRTGSLAVYHADADGTARSRVLNGARQLVELGWWARNLALKVAIATARPTGLERVLRHRGRRLPEWPY